VASQKTVGISANDGPSPEAEQVMDADWFQESPSGGSKQAWQTFYPAAPVEHPSSGSPEMAPSWHTSKVEVAQNFEHFRAEERGVQSLVKPETKSAMWFDDAVGQYDAYGRTRLPSAQSSKRFVEWTERSVNTTVACVEPGCIANTSLQVVDPALEEVTHCRLHIGIHATDFDDDFSRENVEWWTVNGHTVNTFCNPKARGCQAEAQRVLHPCVGDLPIDHVIDEDGKLQIVGKLSPMVDECPVDGNLLSGVATITCMVHSKAQVTAVENSIFPVSVRQPRAAQLRCAEPGCVASGTVLLKETDLPPNSNRTCRLTVRIVQTDFDSQWEKVEWVKLANKTVAQDVHPGRNPCKEAVDATASTGGLLNWTHFDSDAATSTTRAVPDALGNDSAALALGPANLLHEVIASKISTNTGDSVSATVSSAPSDKSASALSDGRTSFVLVDGQDVTSDLLGLNGKLPVSVKISDMVDECGSEGYLLDAEAAVECE
jgi:hypothetical protein